MPMGRGGPDRRGTPGALVSPVQGCVVAVDPAWLAGAGDPTAVARIEADASSAIGKARLINPSSSRNPAAVRRLGYRLGTISDLSRARASCLPPMGGWSCG